jgi:hypothetical protein
MKALLAAVAIVAVHLAMRALGLAEHTSAIAGMPVSEASWVVAPLYVLAYLAAVVVAPILAIAGMLQIGLSVARGRPPSDLRDPR